MPKKQLSPEEEARRRADYQRQLDEEKRQRDAARRKMFTLFKMWMVCPDKRCMRAQACRGDVERCMKERWRPLIPPDSKASISRMLQYLNDGLSPEEAKAKTQADMARHREAMARYEAMQAKRPAYTPRIPAAAVSPDAQPPALPAFSGPRIRSP